MTTKKKEDNSTKPKKNPERPLESIPNKSEDKTNNGNQHGEIRKNNEPNSSNRGWFKASTIANVLATVAIAIFTWQLAQYGEKQTEIFEFENRPYPLLTNIIITESLQVGRNFSAMAVFKNFGKIPAYNFTTESYFVWGDKLAEKEIISGTPRAKQASVWLDKTIVPPQDPSPDAGVAVNVKLDRDWVTPEFFDSLKTEKLHLFYRVYIKFHSVPDTTTIRESFCMMYIFHAKNFMFCKETF